MRREDKIGQDNKRKHKIRQHKTRQDKTRQDKTRQDQIKAAVSHNMVSTYEEVRNCKTMGMTSKEKKKER